MPIACFKNSSADLALQINHMNQIDEKYFNPPGKRKSTGMVTTEKTRSNNRQIFGVFAHRKIAHQQVPNYSLAPKAGTKSQINLCHSRQRRVKCAPHQQA
jgi:hypothetical protein